MTWKDLAAAILSLPAERLKDAAVVWPPEGCPAVQSVAVTGVGNLPLKKDAYTLLTGKEPGRTTR